MRTYKPIIDAIEQGESMTDNHPLVLKMVEECKEKFKINYVCVLGSSNLEVVEVDPPFKISDYDGFESITKSGDSDDWILEE